MYHQESSEHRGLLVRPKLHFNPKSQARNKKKSQLRFTAILAVLLIASIQLGLWSFSQLVKNFDSAQASALNSHYVDSAAPLGGNGSITSPFKTIQECASIAVSGDSCLIRGGTYRETVKPVNSGVTFQNYQNEQVVVSGTEIVPNSSFAAHSTNVYKAPVNWSLNVRQSYLQSTNNQIFVDGQMMVEARWPNIPVANVTNITNIAGKREDNARSDGAQIFNNTSAKYTDTDLAGSGDFWGVGTNKGKINFLPGYRIMATTCDIATKDASSVGFQCTQDPGQGNNQRTIDTAAGAMLAPKKNNYYYLWGKLEALDNAGEFFVDPPNNNLGTVTNDGKGNYVANTSANLYLQMPDNGNPQNSGKVIEMRKRMFGFDLTGKANTNIKGIKLFASTIRTNATTSNLTLENLDMKYLWHTQELPPYFYDAGTDGLVLSGTGNTVKNSTVAFTPGNAIKLGSTGGNQILNNVIYDTGYEAFGSSSISGGSQNVNNKNTIKNNTIFNAGRYQVNLANSLDVQYNDIYNSHLQITDLGAIYGWGTDGKGSRISHNFVHDVLGQKDNADYQYGGHGIYLDDETTDVIVDHNVVWNTTAGSIMAAGYRPWITQHSNTGKTSNNRKIYNNTSDGEIGLLNKCNSPSTTDCGFQTGTEFKNNIFTGHTSQPVLESKYGTIDWATNFWGSPRFVDKPNLNYNLRPESPAVDAGTVLSPYTDGGINSPDIGAYEIGKVNFVAGAVLTDSDLEALNVACSKDNLTGTCVFTNLPLGKKIPENFQVKAGTGTSSGTCTNQTNYQTNLTTTTCTNIDLNNQTGSIPVSIQIGSGTVVTKGNSNFDGLNIIQVVKPAADRITVSGLKFQQGQGGYSKSIDVSNTSGQNLYDYQVLVTVDTQSLIAGQKVRTDCGDIRFYLGSEILPYWLEDGCNTTTTNFWVKVPYIPTAGAQVQMTYGFGARASASDGRATFVMFEDFESPTLHSAITYNANQAGMTLGPTNGYFRTAGTTTSTNQYSTFGFNVDIFKLGRVLPANYAIDSHTSVVSGVTRFKGNFGGFDNFMTVYGTIDGTNPTKRIGYYSNAFQLLGRSKINTATFNNKKVSLGVGGVTANRNLYWLEDNNLTTPLATRTGISSLNMGYFNYGPDSLASFETRVDNVRFRNFTSSGIEPTAMVGTEEFNGLTYNGEPLCSNVISTSETQIDCYSNKTLEDGAVINITQQQETDRFVYITPTTESHDFGSVSNTTGSTVNLEDGTSETLGLNIPAGYSTVDGEFYILKKPLTVMETTASTNIASGYKIPGNNFYRLIVINPDNQKMTAFDQPIGINIKYLPEDLANYKPETLKIIRWDGTQWNDCTDNFAHDKTNYIMSCSTQNFSDFAIVGVEDTPVYISEINWSGTSTSTQDQWIELYNNSDFAIDLNNWQVDLIGTATTNLGLNTVVCTNTIIAPRSYYLISKFSQTDPTSSLNISPDCVLSSLTIEQTGLKVIVKDPAAAIIDETANFAG